MTVYIVRGFFLSLALTLCTFMAMVLWPNPVVGLTAIWTGVLAPYVCCAWHPAKRFLNSPDLRSGGVVSLSLCVGFLSMVVNAVLGTGVAALLDHYGLLHRL
jgi:energy-coupling factor transporter transmembrane protein EcfT